MPASYNVIPVLQTPTVNPGETVKIEIYISGAGNTWRKRLHILHPYPDLFQENVGTISPGIAQIPAEEADDDMTVHREDGDQAATEGDSGYIARPYKDAPEEYRIDHEMGVVATAIAIPDWLFQPVPEGLIRGNEHGAGEGPAPHFPVKLSEGKWGETAPWVMELNISEDAEPGDYELDFIFTYETEIIISSRRSVQIHVNDWIEKRQPNLKRVVVTIALLSLLSQAIGPILSLISGLLGYLGLYYGKDFVGIISPVIDRAPAADRFRRDF